jgi:hypothetical protein
MTHKARFWILTLVLTLWLVPRASAFPPFPPFQCPWHEARDCPRSSYCCLHYVLPSIYTFRAYHRPPTYATYLPDGGYRIDKYCCRISDPTEQALKYIEVGREKSATDPAKPPPDEAKPR